jgi:hypothetical protein
MHIFCPYCRARLGFEKDIRFCMSCGRNIEKLIKEFTPSPFHAPGVQSDQVNEPTFDQDAYDQASAFNSPPTPPKGSAPASPEHEHPSIVYAPPSSDVEELFFSHSDEETPDVLGVSHLSQPVFSSTFSSTQTVGENINVCVGEAPVVEGASNISIAQGVNQEPLVRASVVLEASHILVAHNEQDVGHIARSQSFFEKGLAMIEAVSGLGAPDVMGAPNNVNIIEDAEQHQNVGIEASSVDEAPRAVHQDVFQESAEPSLSQVWQMDSDPLHINVSQVDLRVLEEEATLSLNLMRSSPPIFPLILPPQMTSTEMPASRMTAMGRAPAPLPRRRTKKPSTR